MIKNLIKAAAYTVGFVALGTIGVTLVAYLENADYGLE
jgi:hypothetical protein